VVFVTGSLLNFAAFAFAPQSILASLEGIQFVTNVAFGKCVQGKHISKSMYAGTVVTIIGVVLTVLSASVVGTLEADFVDLLKLWQEIGWLLYLLFTVILGVMLQALHQVCLKQKALGTPLAYTEYVLPVTYATFSALFGTLSVVFAKILSELLTLQIEGTPIFYGKYCWFTYVTLVGWLALVGVWLYRMNEALSLYDPLFIIPLLQMNFILFAIISGGIYFKEFNQFQSLNWIGFIIGVFLLFLGIFLLSPNSENSSQIYPDEDEVDQDDQTREPVIYMGASAQEDGSPRVVTIVAPPILATPRSPLRTPRKSFVNNSNDVTMPLPFYSLIPASQRKRKKSNDEKSLFNTMSKVHALSSVVAALNSKASPPKKRRSFSAHDSRFNLAELSVPSPTMGRRRADSLNRLSSPIPMNTPPISLHLEQIKDTRSRSADAGGADLASVGSMSDSEGSPDIKNDTSDPHNKTADINAIAQSIDIENGVEL
jgi:hypothetical protein